MQCFGETLSFAIISLCTLYLSQHKLKRLAEAGGHSRWSTLTVLTAPKQQHRVCLAEIDAPEKHQPFGVNAKQSLSELCFDRSHPLVKDRYQRIVAWVKRAGGNVNAEQVNRGMPGSIGGTQRTMTCMCSSMAQKSTNGGSGPLFSYPSEWPAIAQWAVAQDNSHGDFLEKILNVENDARLERQQENRKQGAG